MSLESTHLLEAEIAAYRLMPLTEETLHRLNALASGYKTIEPIHAIELAAEAVRLAESVGNEAIAARAWAIRAYAEAQIEQDEAAKLHGEQAKALSNGREDPITIGYASLAIGQYFVNQFRYDEALEVGLAGYALLEQARDWEAQANITFLVMGAYSRLGQRQQAESYAFRALHQYQELGKPGGEVVQLNNLAMHFFWMEEYDKARRYAEEAVALLRTLIATEQPFDFAFARGGVMHTLAEIAIAQEDLAAAELLLQEGLTFVRESTTPISPNDETFLLLALGKLHLTERDFGKARRTLLTALWKARRDHHRLLMVEIAEVLMKLYQKSGNFRRALWYSNFYHSIDKVRYHEQLVSKMRRLEMDYEISAARREMELLAEKNRELEQAYRDLQAAHSEIHHLSIRDGLTKLFNRQHFEEWAATTLEHCWRQHDPFAILLTDIDNFKRINDTWLHHTGDKVIQVVAAELQAVCPARGKVARYGGEEFVLAIPACTLDQMKVVAEHFRQRVANYAWQTVHPEVHVTVSGGIAVNDQENSLTKQLIQADLNLYLAKRNGKNRVVADELGED